MQILSRLGVGTVGRRLLGVRLGVFRQYPPRAPSVERLASPDPSDAELPSIALVTPSYNQAPFVGQTIESVLAQGYPNLQYVVQDAQSADGTAQVLARFAGCGVDVRIEKDAGQADALNRGFLRTGGELMAYLNSDDLLLPGALLLVGRYFRDHPEVDVVYGNRLIVDEMGREVGRWVLPGHVPEVLRFVDYVPQESLFWRRRIWEKTGSRMDVGLHFALDWDLILRFMEAGATIRHLPCLFGVFRTHDRQKTRAQFAASGMREISEVRARYRAGAPASALERLHVHWRFLSKHREVDRQTGYAT